MTTTNPPASTSGASRSTDSTHSGTLVAMLWMLGALISFSMLAVAGREAGQVIATLDILFFRSVIGLAIVLAIAAFTSDGLRGLGTTQLPMHLFRNAMHYAAQYAWFVAVTIIPLAQLFALEFTTPLWVALIAPLFLREKLTVARIAAAVLGFVGVLVIVQPGAVALDQGSLLALGSAIGFAGSVVAVKFILRQDTALSVLFHMAWMQLVFGFVLLGGQVELPPYEVWGWLLLIGVFSLTAHFSLARAYARADAVIVAPMDFLRLPAITVVGYLIYGEAVGLTLLIGGAIIIAANVLNVFGDRRR